MTSSHLPRDFKRTVLYMNILLLLSWLFNPAFAFLVHGLAWRRPHSTVDSDRDSDVKPSSGGDTRPWSIATTEKKGTRSLATPKPTRFVLRRSRTTLHERTKRWWDLGLFRTEKKYQDYRKDDTTDNSKPNRTLISIKVLLNRPNRTLSENAPHSGNISESDREFMHRANILVDMMEDRLLNRIAKKVSKTLDRDLNKAFGQLELQSLHEHDPQQPPRHEHDPQQPSRHEHDPQQPSRHEHDPQQLSRHEHHPQQPSNRLPTSDVSSVAAVSTAQRIPCAPPTSLTYNLLRNLMKVNTQVKPRARVGKKRLISHHHSRNHHRNCCPRHGKTGRGMGRETVVASTDRRNQKIKSIRVEVEMETDVHGKAHVPTARHNRIHNRKWRSLNGNELKNWLKVVADTLERKLEPDGG